MPTFATLKSRVSKRLGLDETGSGNEDVLLAGYLNDAVRDFLLRTRIKVARGQLDAAATDDANLSLNVLQLLDLTVTASDNTKILPERTSAAEILRMRRVSPSTTGSTRWYALQGNELLMFYPDLTTSDVVTVYYVPKPTEMSTGTHDPSDNTYGGIPVEYHPALEEYAAWKMADYDDDGSSSMGVLYHQEYERLVRQAIKAIRGKGGRRAGRAVLAQVSSRVSSDPART